MQPTIIALVAIFILLPLGAVPGYAETFNPILRLVNSGDIRGTIECPEGSPAIGALVHLAGKSFMARTDVYGEFRIFNVPEGSYDLVVKIPGKAPFSKQRIQVKPGRTRELGVLLPCETTCHSNAPCAGGYCRKLVGNCQGQGVCAERPQICPNVYWPVCGCDGKTYGSACEAASQGMNVAFEGECR